MDRTSDWILLRAIFLYWSGTGGSGGAGCVCWRWNDPWSLRLGLLAILRALAVLEREDPDSPGSDEGGFRCGGGLPIRLMRLSLTKRSSSFPLILGLLPRPDEIGEDDGER